MTDKERFGGKCPYNGSPCETFHCSKCVIEEQEREFMDESVYSNEKIYKELINTQELLHSVSARVYDIQTRVQYIEKEIGK